jgi:hypothetical protein
LDELASAPIFRDSLAADPRNNLAMAYAMLGRRDRVKIKRRM